LVELTGIEPAARRVRGGRFATGGQTVETGAFEKQRGFVRGANSLPTGGREEVRAAGAGAELGVRRAVEPCLASRSPVRREAQTSSEAEATCWWS
jgi:hypothetical protein